MNAYEEISVLQQQDKKNEEDKTKKIRKLHWQNKR